MELLKDLPHEKRLCTLVKEDQFCEACNTALVSVGEEFVRTEVEYIHAKVKVIDIYRETFECRNCRKNGHPYMEKSPMPSPVILISIPPLSLAAQIVMKNWCATFHQVCYFSFEEKVNYKAR